MKNILALLLAFTLLFALAACTENPSTEPTQEPYDDGNNAVNDDPEATEHPPVDPTKEPHFHNYTSAVTKEATCTVEGELTYSCACGDSYAETVLVADHTWGEWEMETPALVSKPGTDKRTCTDCGEFIERERTANAITNSFYDGGLIRIINNNYGTISASALLEYASREFHEYADVPVAAETIYAALAQRFDITGYFDEPLTEFQQERWGYDADNNTYTLHDYGDTATLVLLGYVHLGDNRYNAYFAFTPDGIDATLVFKVELEYNKLNGVPNKYLSIERVDTAPEDMIKCSEGEIYELSN